MKAYEFTAFDKNHCQIWGQDDEGKIEWVGRADRMAKAFKEIDSYD